MKLVIVPVSDPRLEHTAPERVTTCNSCAMVETDGPEFLDATSHPRSAIMFAGLIAAFEIERGSAVLCEILSRGVR